MDKDSIVVSNIMLELTDRLKKRLAFNITYRTAHFDDGYLCILSAVIAVKTALYLICDMRDYLNRTSAIITTAFFVKN